MGAIEKLGLAGAGVVGLFVLSCLAAWVTHIIVAIGALIGSTSVSIAYGILLAVGVFMPPVGVIHGFGVWFGAW